jgi:hypothetical protein
MLRLSHLEVEGRARCTPTCKVIELRLQTLSVAEPVQQALRHAALHENTVAK